MKVSEVVYRGKVVNVARSFERENPSAFFEIVEHPGSAAVVALTGKGKLLLVDQYREAVGGYLLEIPAGKLEREEDPATCAARELEEETGYRAGSMEKLFELFTTPGYCNENIHFFVATGLVASKSNPDENEVLEPVELEVGEALEMIDDGRIRDAKTVAGILEFVRRRKWSLHPGA
ncbi:MAG: NUDIX hydrolase [Candidatus Eiseniibacteriota bacterium]|nr:MAG: NUDIX hydrolase [Candidatus Eisenbacteria bacterium]